MSTTKANPVALWDLSKEVSPGFIKLTRRGKTVGYLLLASHYDEEDVADMTDPAFWKMIRERSKGPFIPWEDVKAKLIPRDGVHAVPKSNGRKKGKRNAAA